MIRDDSGREYLFGDDTDSSSVEMGKFNSQLMSLPISTGWPLTLIRDDSGNSIRLEYELEGAYSSPAFEDQWYETRDDMWPHYVEDYQDAEEYLDAFMPEARNIDYLSNTHRYRSSIIKKITFPQGYILFETDSDNTLSGFSVHDNQGHLVRRVTFNKVANNLSSSLALLDNVQVSDASGIVVQTYGFSYNNEYTGTPGSNISFDYWGYFNGATTLPGSHLPTRSFVCYGSEGLYGGMQPETTLTIGNGGNRTPHAVYMMHNILNKIVYPSGGSSCFTFEPNEYSRSRGEDLGSISTGPGVRIRQIEHKDKDGSCTGLKTVYTYHQGVIPVVPDRQGSNTLTSYMANVGIMEDQGNIIGYICPHRVRRVTPVSTPYSSVGGEAVTYSRITREYHDAGVPSGKRVDHFVVPDNYQLTYNFNNSSEVPWRFTLIMEHLLTETLSYNNSYLDKSELYDATGTLLQRTTYHYAQTVREQKMNMGFFHLVHYNYPYYPGDENMLADYRRINHMQLFSGGAEMDLAPPLVYYFYTSGRGVRYPGGARQETYHPQGTFTTERKITYTLSQPYHYPRTFSELTSSGDTLVTRMAYPFDSLAVDSYRSMVLTHFLPSAVLSQTLSHHNGTQMSLLESRGHTYDSLPGPTGEQLFRPACSYHSLSGDVPRQVVEYLSYNVKGMPTHIRINNNRQTSYIWSYDNKRPVAVVQGASLQQVQNAVGVQSLSTLGEDPDPSWTTISQVLSQCRGIEGSLTRGASYRPLYGVSNITGTTGNHTAFMYDLFGRLASITDHNGNIVSHFSYSDQQGEGNTYVRSFSPDSAVTLVHRLPVARQRINTTYYDGLYRPVQQVARSASPTSSDMVYVTEYNAYGSVVGEYMPYTVVSSGGYRTQAHAEQQQFYELLYSGEGPYAAVRREYDSSPLQRTTRENMPGSDYSTTYRSSRYGHDVNGSQEVERWSTGTAGSLVYKGSYAPGTLRKTTTTDADQNAVTLYHDKQGRLVESITGATAPLTTSYVYDLHGRLAWVIPPQAQDQVKADPSDGTLCFHYLHDERNRVIEQYTPGRGTTRYVYDADDRLVFMQDPNMGEQDRWRFTRYDRLGREVFSGLVTYTGSASALRDSYSNVAYNEHPATGTGSLAGHTNTTQPLEITANDLLMVKWYDGYLHQEKIPFTAMGNEVSQPTGYLPAATPHGMSTGMKVKVLDGAEHTQDALWLVSTLYYDNLDRPIQEVRQTYTGSDKGLERTSTAYRHRGELSAQKSISSTAAEQITLLEQRQYDHRGRLTKQWSTIDDSTAVQQKTVTYDQTGRPASLSMGGGCVLTEYTHDMQGRLTKINNPDNPAGAPFCMELQYQDPDIAGATARYTAGASATRWIHHSGSTQTYVYNYDQHSRLISGVHSGSNNEQAISYDSNGNITSLTRTGTQPAVMSYSYSENRIASVTRDGITHPYTHDSNGNVTTDGIRGMNIDYNHLDLPVTVAKGQDTLKYIYDAQGTKLATAINDTIINYYTGMVVYRDDKSMDYIINSTGMIRKQGQQYVRQYNITDHLGSTRAVVDQSANVIQATDYYPYGLPFQYNSLEKNRYLYNNKEIQNQSLGSVFLGTYDYGARFYDPELGRWHSVDPMAEMAYSWTPYRYGYNNPLRYIDPTGMLEDDYGLDKDGNITLLRETDDMTDKLIALDDKGAETDKSIEVEKGILDNVKSGKDSQGTGYNYLRVGNNKIETNLFEFVSENSSVEWSHVKFGTISNYISTSHNPASEAGGVDLMYNLLIQGYTVREHIHSHPDRRTNYHGPSGFHPNDRNSGDRLLGEWLNTYYPKKGIKLKVYEVPLKRYIEYNHKGIVKYYED